MSFTGPVSSGTLNITTSGTYILNNTVNTINLPSTTGTHYQISLINNTPMFINGECDGIIYSISIDNNYAYVGGLFSTFYKGYQRNCLARFNLVTGLIDPLWNPNVNGQVTNITLDSNNNLCYIGGGFTQVGNVNVSNLIRIDSSVGSTGAVDPNWMPMITGEQSIVNQTLDTTSNILYICGNFDLVNGLPYNNLARIDGSPSSIGSVDSFWNPSCDGPVSSLALDATNNLLYVAGTFGNVNTLNSSVPRNNIARFDCTGLFNGGSIGLVDSNWDPNCNDSISSILLNNNNLYAGGQFTSVNDEAVSIFGLARFDASIDGDGTVDTTWNPNLNNTNVVYPTVIDILIDSTYLYLIYNTNDIANMARFDLVTATQDLGWGSMILGATYMMCMDVNNNKIYVGPQFGNSSLYSIHTNLVINTFNDNQYFPNGNNFYYPLYDSSIYILIGYGNQWVVYASVRNN